MKKRRDKTIPQNVRKTIDGWVRGPFYWKIQNTLYVSIPFTWNIPEVIQVLLQKKRSWDDVTIGGSAPALMPEAFSGIPNLTIKHDYPGILNILNPITTRTTTGCPNKCKFCVTGLGLIEGGGLKELKDWEDKPHLLDNNLLAASRPHFEKVISRLQKWKNPDFTAGLDVRLMKPYHAEGIATLRKPVIRLALDSQAIKPMWKRALGYLADAGVPKSYIRCYALIGYDTGPEEAWERCFWIERLGGKPFPMWFHPLHTLTAWPLTEEQKNLGWTRQDRIDIQRYFYRHVKPKGSIGKKILQKKTLTPGLDKQGAEGKLPLEQYTTTERG